MTPNFNDNNCKFEDIIEIADLLKINRIEMHKKMLKLLRQSFDSDCEKSKQKLMEIIEYAVSSKGKYYRSFFVNILGESLGINRARTSFIGAIIEMLHNCILMQSATPYIENNDYRYEQESCHKKFGTDKTIIASNALITLIIEIITSSESVKFSNDIRCELIKIIAKYNGKDGVSSGQMMKLMLKKKRKRSQDEDTRIKKLRINSLFNAGAECLELLSKTTDEQNLAIKNYINNFCNLMNIYEEIEKKDYKSYNELLKRASLLTSQGCTSILKIPNNRKLILFIKYNYFCLKKFVDYNNSTRPVIVDSDIVTI